MIHPPSIRLTIDVLVSPVGDLRIVCSDTALCALDFGDSDARLHALLRARYRQYQLSPQADALGATSALRRYFEGEVGVLDTVHVDGGGTAFQQRVWQALRSVPPGQTRSYAFLAAQVGGTHARAIGQANALNPVAIVVPCHRIIGANQLLTGYAGGLARKRWLLDHEARHSGRSPMFAACMTSDMLAR